MDKIIRSIAKNGHFRVFVLDATETVREAQRLHNTMPTSTVALGRTLIAAQILGANEKGKTQITVKVIGDGPATPIVAVADTLGHVKGYIKSPDLDYRRASTGQALVAELVGNGRFIVIKDMGLRTPYTGQVDLITGEIGEDLAWYFLSSEQTPASVGLNVLLDKNTDTVLSATGFLVQAMPDVGEEETALFETNIKKMPGLASFNTDLTGLLDALYGDLPYDILDQGNLSFQCDCNKERFSQGIASLGPAEITAMIEEDHGAEVICQFCEKQYQFTEKELNDLILDMNP